MLQRVEPYVVLLSVIIIVIEGANERGSFFLGAGKIFLSFVFYRVSPGAPPAPVRLPGQKIFEEKFSPFQWTGRWKFADRQKRPFVCTRDRVSFAICSEV